jgi:hypothetical protein
MTNAYMEVFDILTELFVYDRYTSCFSACERLSALADAEAFKPFPEARVALLNLAFDYSMEGNSEDNKLSNIFIRDLMLQLNAHHKVMVESGVWN